MTLLTDLLQGFKSPVTGAFVPLSTFSMLVSAHGCCVKDGVSPEEGCFSGRGFAVGVSRKSSSFAPVFDMNLLKR